MDIKIRYFNIRKLKSENSFVTPTSVLDENKPFTLIIIPSCDRSENKTKNFIKNSIIQTCKYCISINQITEKVKNLFPLIRQVYFYTGQSKSKMTIRWKEHNNPTHYPEPTKHLYKNIDYSCNWTIFSNYLSIQKQKGPRSAIYIFIKV